MTIPSASPRRYRIELCFRTDSGTDEANYPDHAADPRKGWDLVANGNAHDGYLQIGVIDVTDGTSPVVSALTHVHPHDEITFRVFDVSDSPSQPDPDPNEYKTTVAFPGGPDGGHPWMNIGPADPQTARSSPFSDDVIFKHDFTRLTPVEGGSISVYMRDGSEEKKYPTWRVENNRGEELIAAVYSDGVGRYFYGFRIAVIADGDPNKARIFSADPEMIVRPGT